MAWAGAMKSPSSEGALAWPKPLAGKVVPKSSGGERDSLSWAGVSVSAGVEETGADVVITEIGFGLVVMGTHGFHLQSRFASGVYIGFGGGGNHYLIEGSDIAVFHIGRHIVR